MSTLRHWFVRGLRFDTEVQYLVATGKGLRYAHLPLKLPLDLPAGDGGMVSVVQCAAIVGQVAIKRMAQLNYRDPCMPEDIVGMLRTCAPTAFCEVLDALPAQDAGVWRPACFARRRHGDGSTQCRYGIALGSRIGGGVGC